MEVSHTTESPEAERYRNLLLQEFNDSSLSGIYPIDPPARGPFGEAEIWLKPNAKPVSVPPFRLTGERERAHAKLMQQAIDMHKYEPGKGPWCAASFPVPKKRPGEFRLVVDEHQSMQRS